MVTAVALAATAVPARATDTVTGACPVVAVRNADRGVAAAAVPLWVAAPTDPGVLGTWATCVVEYGDGATLTFGTAALGPAAATATVLTEPGTYVRACPTLGAVWSDGHVVTVTPPCSTWRPAT